MNDALDRFAELNDLTDGVIDAAAGGEADPSTLTFLLRRYRATGRDDLPDILGHALARGAEAWRSAAGCDARSRWLEAFVTAASLSSDPRMHAAIEDLVSALRGEWGQSTNVADLVTSIDACLQATAAFETPGLVPAAIDELERVVAATYRPGHGIAGELGDTGGARRLVDQIRSASALVTACVGTSRLPYGMLAEELVQFARREYWDNTAGAFLNVSSPEGAFVANCDAARMLCRLARLLDDEDYRRGAVVAADSDYRGDASRILASQLGAARSHAAAAAPYALALDDWLSLR